MGDAHRRVGGVHALTAVTGGAVDIDTDVVLFDLNFDIVVSFRQDNDFGCRGMDTPVGLGHGDALDAVRASFVLQTVIRALAFDDEGNILDASLSRLIDIQDFDFPAPPFGVACIHTVKLAREKGRLVTAGTALDGDDSIFLVHNI